MATGGDEGNRTGMFDHRTIRKAKGIAREASPVSFEIEPKTRSSFFVHYDNGQTAEVFWAFIRELPPKTTPAAAR